ncbi:hypothetical protein P5V15_009506 [Pogonomyrmex californicus]
MRGTLATISLDFLLLRTRSATSTRENRRNTSQFCAEPLQRAVSTSDVALLAGYTCQPARPPDPFHGEQTAAASGPPLQQPVATLRSSGERSEHKLLALTTMLHESSALS